MSSKILVRNARLIDPASGLDAAGIGGGRGRPHRHRRERRRRRGARLRDFTAERTIDARGAVVVPGLVDLARAPGRARPRARGPARVRAGGGGRRRRDEPGLPARHRSGARRAGPRRDAQVPRQEPRPGAPLSARRADARARRRGAHRDGRAARSRLRRLLAGRRRGHATRSSCTARMQYAATFGYTVWLRPNDAWLGNGVAAKGPLATRLGLSGVPVLAETIALATIFELVRDTGARVHLCRLSSAAGVDLVRRAKAERLPVTCDVEHPPAAPDRRRHRLLRFGDAPGAAAAPAARPRRDPRRRSPTARSTRWSATTRRSARTPSSCRSPRPSRARPGSSCCSARR